MIEPRIALAALVLAAPAASLGVPDAGLARKRCADSVEAGRMDEARLRCGEALGLARRDGDRKSEEDALRRLGNAAYRLGEYDQAIELHQQALGIARELGDRKGEADACSEIGTVLEEQGRFEEAVRYAEIALAGHRAVNDRGEEAVDLNNLATAQADLSRYPEAIANFEQALVLAREGNDRLAEAAFLQNIGALWRRLGQYRRSMEFLARSLPIRREVGDRRGEGITLDSMGVSHARLGDHARALAFHDQALAIFQDREVNDRNNEGLSLKRSGDALERLGRHEEALERYRRAAELMRELDDRPYQARALSGMGAALRGLGRPGDALRVQEEALVILREAKDLEGEQEVLQELMSTWASLGRPALAIFYGKQAVNAAQGIRSGLAALERDARRSYLASMEVAYRALGDLLLGEGRLPEAEQVLALLKDDEFAGAFEDAAGGVELRQVASTRREAVEEERFRTATAPLAALASELEAARRRRDPAGGDRRRIERLEADLDAARRASTDCLGRIRDAFARGDASPDGLATGPDEQPVLAELRRLGPGAVAVYTLVSRDRVRLLVVAPGRRAAREVLVPRAEVARTVLAFREVLQDPTREPVAAAREAYRILVEPIERDLSAAGATTVLWSLDGVLRYVPVSALHDGRRWLVERYRTAVFTPASLARPAARARQPLSAWAFGVSRGAPGFGPLPAVEAELREIVGGPGVRGVIPGDAVLDAAFTRERMMGALQTRRRPVVHVASHFSFQPGAPAESFLLLGDGGRMTLEELAAFPGLLDGVEVVSLSACDTTVSGGEQGGRELEGFAALAQRLGARATLATLWPVEDESTRRVMATFYRLRRGGSGKAEALRAAQLALLERTDTAVALARRSAVPVARLAPSASPAPATRWAHPYFWAPFVLAGEAR